MVKFYSKYFPEVIRKMFSDPQTAASRAMRKQAGELQSLARKNLLRSTGFDTGRLSESIKVVPTMVDGALAYRVGTDLPYAKYIHNGTGIYGPTGQMIRPKHAKALRWKGPGGHYMFAKQVKGIRPNPFLTDAVAMLRG